MNTDFRQQEICNTGEYMNNTPDMVFNMDELQKRLVMDGVYRARLDFGDSKGRTIFKDECLIFKGEYNTPLGPMCFFVTSTDPRWAIFDTKEDMCLTIEIMDDSRLFVAKGDVTASCGHEYVDMGFMYPKFVCRKCNEEKK
jgi:hypothetical protein